MHRSRSVAPGGTRRGAGSVGSGSLADAPEHEAERDQAETDRHHQSGTRAGEWQRADQGRALGSRRD
jgi:hypothetical protein